MVVYRGVVLYFTRGAPISIEDETFLDVYSGRSFSIPHSALIAVVLIVLAAVVLNLTVFGREIRAIGGGERIAFLTGIKVERVKIVVFGLVGLLCGMAGLIITILSNGMNIIGLDPYFQNIVKGLVLVLSVFVTIDRKKIGIIK